MRDILFVYGTLHPDRAPMEIAETVRQFRFLGSGTVRGRIHRLQAYPAVKLDTRNGSRVSGDVFEVPSEETFHTLDAYEGFDPADCGGSLFVRRRVRVKLSEGPTVDCWIYEYNRDFPVSICEGGRSDVAPGETVA